MLVLAGFEARAADLLGDSPARVVPVSGSTTARFLEARRLLRPRPDIVHVNHPASPVLVAARMAGVRGRIATDHVLPRRPRYGTKGEILHRMTRAAANGVIVFSRQNAELAPTTWGDTPVFVVRPGVAEPTCRRPRENVRVSLGLPPDAQIVVSVGRLAAEKRMDVLLRAAALLGDEVRVLVVGEGGERPVLERLASELGVAERVVFTGHRDDVGCLLAASDLYVQCSAWEGMGFAVLEAMAAGLPCVVTDLPPLREAVGEHAPAVRVGDPARLAEAIRTSLEDPAGSTARGEALHARWASVFTVGGMAKETRSVYLSVTGQRGYERAAR